MFYKNQKTKTQAVLSSFLGNLRMIIICLSLISVFSYLVVVNHTNTLGIAIGQMKFKIQELEEQNRDLENEANNLSSMTRIEAISNGELSMVQAETYDYLEPTGAVAVKGSN